MGSSNSQPSITYKLIKREKHSILGLIDFIEADVPNGLKFYTAKMKNFLDRCQFRKFQEKMKQRNSIVSNDCSAHIIGVHHIAQKQKSGYCSNITELQIFYDSIQEDLHLEYLFKKCNKSTYSQGLIITIIEQLLSGIQLAAKRQLKLFHLSKKSIFKRKKGDYCLILYEDNESMHPIDEYITNFDGQMFSKNYYLSPKQLQSINQLHKLRQWGMKDHIFTLGMIILNLCLMKDLLFQSQIISVKIQEKQKEFIFQSHLIKNQLDKIRRLIPHIKYSEKIKKVITKMIQFQEEKRLSTKQLFEILKDQEKGNENENESIYLKKTSKKLNWNRKVQQSKENLKLIPPSLQHINHCKKMLLKQANTQKQVIDVFIDTKILNDDKCALIATQARDYKRAKITSLKIDNFCQKEVISKIIQSQNISKDLFTPIKRLNEDEIMRQKVQSRELFKGIKRFVKTQSVQQCQTHKEFRLNIESRTSLAANLHIQCKSWQKQLNDIMIS